MDMNTKRELDKKIKATIKVLIKLFKERGILGWSLDVNGYYVSFSFEKLNKIKSRFGSTEEVIEEVTRLSNLGCKREALILFSRALKNKIKIKEA